MKIGMIFPGYGSQYVGMAKDIYDESRIVQEYFDQASLCVDINFIKLCFASSDAELSKMQQAYSSLFVVSSSLYAALAQEGIEPSIVAGYGVGQYTAMHAAKGLSFADGLYILKKLTMFAQELLDQEKLGMARVKGLSAEELSLLLKQLVQDHVSIAVYEMPNRQVIVGPEDAVDICMQHLRSMPDVKVEEVPVQFGIFAPHMQPALDKFKMYLEKVDLKDTQIPLVANISGQHMQEGALLKEEVTHHLSKPIQWLDCLKALHTCDLILSVGPGSELVEAAKQLYPNKQILSVATLADIAQVKISIEENTVRMAKPVDEPEEHKE